MYTQVHASTRECAHACDASGPTLVHCVNRSHSFSLALFSSFRLLHVVFILQLVNHASSQVASVIAVRECTACACACASTRVCVCECTYS